MSRGYTCPKGRALPAFHHDPRRLDHPLVRREEGFRRASWDDALDDLAGRLRRIIDDDGPDAVAGYLGTAIAFDAGGYHATNAFLAALGTAQRYTCATLDTPCKPFVSELMSGFPGLHPIPDPVSTTLLLLVGTNPVVSHGHLIGAADPVARLREITRRGEVWVLDPRRTATARRASRHLQLRPGTDTWVLAFLVREILREGADTDYIEQHVEGVELLAVGGRALRSRAGGGAQRCAARGPRGAGQVRATPRSACRRQRDGKHDGGHGQCERVAPLGPAGDHRVVRTPWRRVVQPRFQLETGPRPPVGARSGRGRSGTGQPARAASAHRGVSVRGSRRRDRGRHRPRRVGAGGKPAHRLPGELTTPRRARTPGCPGGGRRGAQRDRRARDARLAVCRPTRARRTWRGSWSSTSRIWWVS